MATSSVFGASRDGTPDNVVYLDARTALQLSVETQPGAGNGPMVVVNVKALLDDAGLRTTLVVDPDTALDLALRLVGCVGRLRKLQMGDTS